MGLKLKDYLLYDHNIDEYRRLFYNMSETMKYIHEKDYCIKTFNLNEIEILDLEKLSPIQYNTVVKMNDNSYEIVHEDIYNLAFMQIGIYSETLNNLRPDFLKENFNDFIPFIPEKDVPYLRGIIVNGSSVYYSDFIDKLAEREIESISSQVGNAKQSNYQKSKSTSIGRSFSEKDVKNLYSDINNQNGAFVGMVIYPFVIGILSILLGIIIQFS